MLFNPKAVRNRVYLGRDQQKFIRGIVRNSPFLVRKDFGKFLGREFEKRESDLETVLHATNWISKYVRYDSRHKYEGFRTPPKVLLDQKGHCLEQNVLLLCALDKLKVATKPVVIKNPRGFKASLKEPAYHLFLKFREGNITYLADQVSNGAYVFDKNFYYTALREMSRRELTAFCFGDGAEDFLLHNKPDKAIQWVTGGLRLDPNNYTFYIIAAGARLMQGNLKRAKMNFEQAISMAPSLADPYIAFGDMMYRHYGKKESYEYYCKAAELESGDLQLLQSLASSLRYLGRYDLAKKVDKKVADLEQARPKKSGLIAWYHLDRNNNIINQHI